MSIETNSKIGLISKALILCGEKPLTSLSDNRYGATVGSSLFELIYEDELQSNRWRFASKKASLSRLVVTPLNEFSYAYQLPSDMLVPQGAYPKYPYEIYGDRLYTNQTSVDLEYTFKPEIEDVPAYFCLMPTYALARDMIKPITESDTAKRIMTQEYGRQRARALYADAQGRPNRPLADSPFTDVR